MRFFNKLERRFDKYTIHSLMYYIITMYIIGFVTTHIDPMFFTRYLSLDVEAIPHGQVWRLVTFLLYPPALNPFRIIFTALIYYLLGHSLGVVWGAFRFSVFPSMGAIDIVLAESVVYFIWGQDMHPDTLHLSMSVFLAYTVIFLEEYSYTYFVLAIKAKQLTLFNAFFLVFESVYGSFPQRIAISLSIINSIIFFLMTKDSKKYDPREVKRRQNPKVKTVRPVNRARHKCTVCGRADEESPGMEFRYCSKCEGSCKYCMDHLYTH